MYNQTYLRVSGLTTSMQAHPRVHKGLTVDR